MPDNSIHASTVETPTVPLEASIIDKLVDAETPGYWAEFTNDEATLAGYFPEEALSEEAAYDASFDNPNIFTYDDAKGNE
jgi:phage-related tail fiber protein